MASSPWTWWACLEKPFELLLGTEEREGQELPLLEKWKGFLPLWGNPSKPSVQRHCQAATQGFGSQIPALSASLSSCGEGLLFPG